MGDSTRRHRARRSLAGGTLVALAVVAAACSSGSSATGTTAASGGTTNYPTGPVTLVAPVSAGSNGDLIARQLASDVKLGATVSVVDQAGAAGITGVTQVVQSPADGSTIGLAPNGVLLLQPQLKQLPYGKPSTYTPVAQVTEEFDAILVSASSPYRTATQFLTYAKAHPGALRVEVAPAGSVPNVNVQLLQKDAGVKFTLVPGVAAAGAVTDLVGGHVDAVVGTINSAQSYLAAHKLRALAVMAPNPVPAYPSVPTLKSLGHDVEVPVTNTIIGPPHLPADVVAKLVSSFRAATDSASFRHFASSTGVTVSYVSGGALTRLLDSQYAALGKYAKEFYGTSGA